MKNTKILDIEKKTFKNRLVTGLFILVILSFFMTIIIFTSDISFTQKITAIIILCLFSGSWIYRGLLRDKNYITYIESTSSTLIIGYYIKSHYNLCEIGFKDLEIDMMPFFSKGHFAYKLIFYFNEEEITQYIEGGTWNKEITIFMLDHFRKNTTIKMNIPEIVNDMLNASK